MAVSESFVASETALVSLPPIRHQKGSFRGSTAAAEAAEAAAALSDAAPPPQVKSELGVRIGLQSVQPGQAAAAAGAIYGRAKREREREREGRSSVKAFYRRPLLSSLLLSTV